MTDFLVLASASKARVKVLTAAGITPLVWAADIDEDAVRANLVNATPAQVVTALAQAKARHVAQLITNTEQRRRECLHLNQVTLNAIARLEAGCLLYTSPSPRDRG